VNMAPSKESDFSIQKIDTHDVDEAVFGKAVKLFFPREFSKTEARYLLLLFHVVLKAVKGFCLLASAWPWE
jgi:hypothetical protein